MPAIITNKFRVNAAAQFKEDFNESADTTNSYYLFFAKSKPWSEVQLNLRDATSGLTQDFVNDEVVWMDNTSDIALRDKSNISSVGVGGAYGTVKYWDSVNKVLTLIDVVGSFNVDGSSQVVFNNLNDLPSGSANINNASAGYYIDTTGETFYDDNTSAPAPIATQANDFRAWKNMIGMKEINAADVSHIIPRINWITAKKYNQYADNIDLEDYPTDSSADSVDSIYVMNSDFSVYKCISNNDSSASTIEPIAVTSPLIETSDGYVWKFMYTISPADVAKFVTSDWIPIRNTITDPGSGQPYETQWDTYNDATGGELYIRVNNGGSGYTQTDDWTSNLHLTIIGRAYNTKANTGTDATIEMTTTINKITIDPIGAGYEYAYATLDSTGPDSGDAPDRLAVIEALVGPEGGHGSNAIEELGANYLMISTTLSGSEGSILSVENDYRQIGLIHNPTIAGSVANGSVYDLTLNVTFNGASGTLIFGEDDEVYVGSSYSDSTTKATVLEFSESASNASCRLTNIRGNEELDSTYGFRPAEVIVAQDDAASYTIASTGITTPVIDFGAGNILYIEHRRPIARNASQVEDIKLILEF